MALTALAIKNLKPKAALYRVADSGGWGIEISPSGSKLWRWRYNFNGKGQMLWLGKYPEVTLEQARRKRDEARALVRAGKYPHSRKRCPKTAPNRRRGTYFREGCPALDGDKG